MSLLFAIKSCGDDLKKGFHSTLRQTWGQHVVPQGGDLRFFVGAGVTLDPVYEDEVRLSAQDDYHSLPWKTREIVKWAVERNYDHAFLCDTDTFAIPRKLVKTGFENWDYYGVNSKPLGVTFNYTAPDRNRKQWRLPQCYPWMSGGVGYFISNKAMRIIEQRIPDIWAEDLWIGQIMGPLYNTKEITAENATYECEASWHFPRNRSRHRSFDETMQEWVREMYEKHQEEM